MSDVFDRLKNKARPTVPPRDTTLIKVQNDESYNDQITEFSHSVNVPKSSHDNNQPAINTIDHPNHELELELPEIVRRTIRLEQTIDTKLNNFCITKKITRETFLEAAFLVCSENQELMQEILEEAKKRYQQRKQAGEQRKFQTMVKKNNIADQE